MTKNLPSALAMCNKNNECISAKKKAYDNADESYCEKFPVVSTTSSKTPTTPTTAAKAAPSASCNSTCD
jgi:hypothetical protein